MDVKDAVARAKASLSDLFSEEGVLDLRLEEVERDEPEKAWNITLGFLRKAPPSPKDAAAALGLAFTLDAISARRRAYRVVRVKDDGTVVSVKHRDLSADAA